MRVQRHLYDRVRDRALAVRNERVLQHPSRIVLTGTLQPRGLLRLSRGEALNEIVERARRPTLLLEDERRPQNGEKPEAIRQQNVMKQLQDFGVLCRSAIPADRLEQVRVRVCLVSDQIAQKLQHVFSRAIHRSPADHGADDLDVLDPVLTDGVRIVRKDHEIRELARRNRSLD